MAPPARRRRGPSVGQVRLVSGLVLVAYVATHLLNHALGLVSLDAMEQGRWWFLALWRNPLGTAVLYGALLTHPLLGLWALYRRRHLRIPAAEAWQLGLGLTIPVLLASHVVGTRIAHSRFGTDDAYVRVLLALWELQPQNAIRQSLVVCIAWTHACLGLHFWLRMRPWYPRAGPYLLAMAILVPTLGLAGFTQGGREVSRLAREPGWAEAAMRATGPTVPGAAQRLARIQDVIIGTYGLLLGGTLAARASRAWAARRRGLMRVTYPDGRTVTAPIGLTILEASRLGSVAHTSVCGGRGRCSTCRVDVTVGLDLLPPPSPAEQRVLRRVGAGPRVRLACQTRPVRDVAVTPLVQPPGGGRGTATVHEPVAGAEQEVVVLFADLRGFTRIAERKLPYDVVFLLNRYFQVVGEAIRRAGGIANQFAGDGAMALFGVGVTPEEGSRQALRAAADMVRGVAALSDALAADLPAPLRIGVGIHLGPAVVGRMGYADTVYLTAVGDTVNVASRIEQLTKDFDAELVVSEALALRAGLEVSRFPRHELTVRNRTDPLPIRVIADAAALGEAPGGSA